MLFAFTPVSKPGYPQSAADCFKSALANGITPEGNTRADYGIRCPKCKHRLYVMYPAQTVVWVAWLSRVAMVLDVVP